MAPLVSILVPSHNASRWLDETLQSSLDQTWPETELIVIDDGSTDGSPELLARWQDRATVVLRENRGGNPTRNELLGMARGAWVQFLDADDGLKPDKIARQMAVVEQDPAADVIYSPLVVEHHAGGRVTSERWAPHDPGGDHDAWAYHLAWDLTQTGGALFRRDTLVEVGGWNEAQPCCQDNELFFRLLQAGAKFAYCDHAGAIYRRFEDGSVSTRDPARVRSEILRLLALGEAHLRSRGELTKRRHAAVNNLRFGLARQLWPVLPAIARATMAVIRESDPEFQPAPGRHAPRAYRWCFRLFGFEAAERISGLKRTFSPS